MGYPAFIYYYKKQAAGSEGRNFVCPFCDSDLSALQGSEKDGKNFKESFCPQCKKMVIIDFFYKFSLKPFTLKDLLAVFLMLCTIFVYLMIILI
jgi:hypothetical protein